MKCEFFFLFFKRVCLFVLGLKRRVEHVGRKGTVNFTRVQKISELAAQNAV